MSLVELYSYDISNTPEITSTLHIYQKIIFRASADYRELRVKLNMNTLAISAIGTVYNNSNIVEDSLKSILEGLVKNFATFEIVVVDNYSDDGTYEILHKYEGENVIVIRALCSRGKGRQIALENARFDYVFPIDLDTIYSFDYFTLLSNIVEKGIDDDTVIDGIAKKSTLLKLGGWRDLNVSEDIELCARAIHHGIKWFILPYNLMSNEVISRREKRYASGFAYIKRVITNRLYKIRGAGINAFGKVNARTFLDKVIMWLFVILAKVLGLEIYSYSNYNNWDYAGMHWNFYNYTNTSLPKEKMSLTLYKFNFSPNTLKQISRSIAEIGYSEYEYSRDFVIFRRL